MDKKDYFAALKEIRKRILAAMGYRRQMPQFSEEGDYGQQWDLEEVLE